MLAAIVGAVAMLCVIAAASAYADSASVVTTVQEGISREPGDAPEPILVSVSDEGTQESWWSQNFEVLVFLAGAVVLVLILWLLLANRPNRRGTEERRSGADTQRHEDS